jgi:hypothetical protein
MNAALMEAMQVRQQAGRGRVAVDKLAAAGTTCDAAARNLSSQLPEEDMACQVSEHCNVHGAAW